MKFLILLFCVFACGVFSVGAAEVAAETSSDDSSVYETKIDVEALDVMKKRHDSMKKEFMENRLKKMGLFEDPRYAKKVYGGMQGVQNSVDKQHQRLAVTKDFETEEEKQAFEKNLRKDAVLTFKDFNATPEQISEDITAEPFEKTREMVANMKLMNEDYSVEMDENHEDLRKRVESLFEEENGMSFDAYMELLEEQAKAEAEQLVQPEKLNESVRFNKEDSEIKVEKVNETTALIKRKGS